MATGLNEMCAECAETYGFHVGHACRNGSTHFRKEGVVVIPNLRKRAHEIANEFRTATTKYISDGDMSWLEMRIISEFEKDVL